jgi:hypothetical protein
MEEELALVVDVSGAVAAEADTAFRDGEDILDAAAGLVLSIRGVTSVDVSDGCVVVLGETALGG